MGTICCHYPLTKDGNTSPYATSVVFPPPNSFRSYFFKAKFIGNANPPLLGFVTLAQGVKGRIQRWVGVKFLDIEGSSQFLNFCSLMFQGPKWFQNCLFLVLSSRNFIHFFFFPTSEAETDEWTSHSVSNEQLLLSTIFFFSWKNLEKWFLIFFLVKLFDAKSKNESFLVGKLFLNFHFS